MNLINRILKPFNRHLLFMDYLTAKSLQNSLSKGKYVFIKGCDLFQKLEQIESDLEDFTDTACLHFTVVTKPRGSIGDA